MVQFHLGKISSNPLPPLIDSFLNSLLFNLITRMNSNSDNLYLIAVAVTFLIAESVNHVLLIGARGSVPSSSSGHTPANSAIYNAFTKAA